MAYIISTLSKKHDLPICSVVGLVSVSRFLSSVRSEVWPTFYLLQHIVTQGMKCCQLTCFVEFMLWLCDHQVLNVAVLYMITWYFLMLCAALLCLSPTHLKTYSRGLEKITWVFSKLRRGHHKSHESWHSRSEQLWPLNVTRSFMRKSLGIRLPCKTDRVNAYM